jgi:predicted HTH transcriptional regulator
MLIVENVGIKCIDHHSQYLRNLKQANMIAEELGVSSRQVERSLAILKERSIIRRVGANKNGYWEVIG